MRKMTMGSYNNKLRKKVNKKAERESTNGAKIKKWGRCQLVIAQLLCVASHIFPTFSVFKVVYHEHPFAFSPSAMSVIL